ncbi:hypothetical protein FS837_004758 [Tulasnella sp. UAMH 9824]|nr:hypothetical protein FS837_004758 [Tulasnella sp. UAMH 9824]
MQHLEIPTPTPIYALHGQQHHHLASTLGLPSTTSSSAASSSSTLQGALLLDMATNANSSTPPSSSSSASSSSYHQQQPLHASSASPAGSRPTTGHGPSTGFGAPTPNGATTSSSSSSALSRPLPSGFGLQPVIDSPLPSIPELPLTAHEPSPPTQLPSIHGLTTTTTAVNPSSSWPPPQHHHHQHQQTQQLLQLPPPLASTTRRQFPPALDVQPFAYNTQYSTPFDSWGGFNEGRRWSVSDPHVPQSAPAASAMYSQRPWTSSASSSSFGGGATGGSSTLSHFGSSSSSSSASHSAPSHHPSSSLGGNATNTSNSSTNTNSNNNNNFGSSTPSGHVAPSSSPSYSSDHLTRPHSHHSHSHSPSSYLSSRPSTTSSLSSYASSSSHLATPHSGPIEPFFGSSGGLKRSDGSSFYSIGGANESTDTIVGVQGAGGLGGGGGHYATSHHSQQHHQAAAVDDSNPFFFARELQSLQVTQERAQAAASLRRPSSSHLHPTLQTALASTSPTDAFQFYGNGGGAGDQYGPTPPSTGGSTGYFDNNVNLPRPPSGYNGRPSSSGLGSLGSLGGVGVVEHHLLSANTVGSSNPNTPSPYSLIVENPDPATKQSRPHLCTHCNETFRRIHDAKRHAYGALGIKNYACMGGCGMTFKRSEGRARHWQREEVAGVGHNITIAEFFTLNPAMIGTPIGSRDGPNGGGLNPQGMMIWGGKGCEQRHGMVMNGTMEEDRRLRNKARRERILMIGARASNAGMNKKKDSDEEGSPVSPTTAEGNIGPMRKQRTSYASVSPY